MIFFKIIAILLATGAGLLQSGLEHKWHDKRTKKHKRVRYLLIFLMIVGFVTASILVIYDDRQAEKQIKTLTDLKNSAEKAAIDAENRESQAIIERESINEELKELQEQIKPVVKLAIEKYPSLDVRSALVKLADDVQDLQKQNEELQKQTKSISVRDYFQPLNSEIKDIVIENLKHIQSALNTREIEIKIISETGNTNRQKVAIELIAILNECNFKTTGPTSKTTYSKGVLPPIRISFNETDKDFVLQLADALNPFLHIQFAGKVKKDIEPGKINIAIHGNPLFSENGSVTFP